MVHFCCGESIFSLFPPIPLQTRNPCCYLCRAVLFGGFNGKELLNDVHLLDLSTFVWTCVSIAGVPLPPSHGHCAAQVPGTSTVRVCVRATMFVCFVCTCLCLRGAQTAYPRATFAVIVPFVFFTFVGVCRYRSSLSLHEVFLHAGSHIWRLSLGRSADFSHAHHRLQPPCSEPIAAG